MDDVFKMMGLDEKAKLAMLGEKYIETILKYFQILYYAHNVGNEDLAEEVSKKFEPLIKVLADNMSEETQKYQAKHGEI